MTEQSSRRDYFAQVVMNTFGEKMIRRLVPPGCRPGPKAEKRLSAVKKLEDAIKVLEAIKGSLKRVSGEDHATEWLQKVDEAIGDEVIIDSKGVIKINKSLKKKDNAARKTEEILQLIDVLIGKLCNPLGVEPSFKYSGEVLASRVSLLEKIMHALADPKLNMIGVHGIGGVGKTTLAKHVQRQAVDEGVFDIVVMVTMSSKPDIRRIQNEIADVLGLELDGKDELTKRAIQLSEKLKSGHEQDILIIVDDVLGEGGLKAIGIPFGDCNTGGCKLLLTSRDQYVLSNQIGTQENFCVSALSKEESWSLFRMTMDTCVLHAMATDIANKCAGLPLIIVKIAKDLQNKGPLEWDYKLEKLSVCEVQDLPQRHSSVLLSSFHDLDNKKAKSLLLLCILFEPSAIQIEYLVRYSVGLGLLEDVGRVEDARNIIFELIRDLKSECWLQDGDLDGFVKMHDLVRDGLLIESRKQHHFIGADGAGVESNKDFTRISVSSSHELPKGGSEFRKTELLTVSNEGNNLEVPDISFEKMRNLKVLGLSGMHYEELPLSVGNLTKLQTLYLCRCKLKDVAVIGELEKLKVLSFAHSQISELPEQIQQLTCLQLLDLSNCLELKYIPAKVLSKLSLLEELYMGNSFFSWDVESNASLTELANLSNLTTLEVAIPEAKTAEILFSIELKRYKIFIGYKRHKDFNLQISKMLRLNKVGNDLFNRGIERLMDRVEDLYFDEVSETDKVLHDEKFKGFLELKHLHIRDEHTIRHISKFTYWAAFPNLESLILVDLSKLEKICLAQTLTGSFENLRNLEVRKCKRLKNLFSLSIATSHTKLRKLAVTDCESVEEIVTAHENKSSEISPAITNREDERHSIFSELRSLILKNLPGLKSFWPSGTEFTAAPLFSSKDISASLQHLQLYQIPCTKIWHHQPRALTTLIVGECPNLEYLFKWTFLELLRKVEIYDCKIMEQIIVPEEEPVEEIQEKTMMGLLFPKLRFLKLKNLPCLISFCGDHRIEFPSLQVLDIANCRKWEKLQNFVHKTQASGKNFYTSFKKVADSLSLLVDPNMCSVRLDGKVVKLDENVAEDEEEDDEKQKNAIDSSIPTQEDSHQHDFNPKQICSQTDDRANPPADTFGGNLNHPNVAELDKHTGKSVKESIHGKEAAFSTPSASTSGSALASRSGTPTMRSPAEEKSATNKHHADDVRKSNFDDDQATAPDDSFPGGLKDSNVALLDNDTETSIHKASTSDKERSTGNEQQSIAPGICQVSSDVDLEKLPELVEGISIQGFSSFTLDKIKWVQHLYLIDCVTLESFPQGEFLEKLKTLHIQNCKKLSLKLQTRFSQLEHLSIESSCNCSQEEFSSNLFPRLTILCLSDWEMLQHLSISLISLESLEIRDCSDLESVSLFSSEKGKKSVSLQVPSDEDPGDPKLKSLTLSNCKNLQSLPEPMHRMKSLQTLFLSGCPKLESLPKDLPGSLNLLCILFCSGIKLCPDLKLDKLGSLRHFEIEGEYENIRSFPEEGILPTNLVSLRISQIPGLTSLNEKQLGKLTSLKKLEIDSCKSLLSFPDELPSSLTFLSIKECPILKAKLQNKNGLDWYNIVDIPSVYIDDEEVHSQADSLYDEDSF